MAESKKNRAIAAELIAKAIRDSAFRARFLADPKAALIAAGAEIDANVEIRAVENTDKLRYIILPALPGDASELSEAQLAAIAGGGQSTTTTIQVTEADTTTSSAANAAGPVPAVCVVVTT